MFLYCQNKTRLEAEYEWRLFNMQIRSRAIHHEGHEVHEDKCKDQDQDQKHKSHCGTTISTTVNYL